MDIVPNTFFCPLDMNDDFDCVGLVLTFSRLRVVW